MPNRSSDSATMPSPVLGLDAPIRKRKIEVFLNGEVVYQMVFLEHKADVLFVQLPSFLCGQCIHPLSHKQYWPVHSLSKAALPYRGDGRCLQRTLKKGSCHRA